MSPVSSPMGFRVVLAAGIFTELGMAFRATFIPTVLILSTNEHKMVFQMFISSSVTFTISWFSMCGSFISVATNYKAYKPCCDPDFCSP